MTKPKVNYRKITGDYVSTLKVAGKEVLQIQPEALTKLASEAMIDIAHLLRPAHLQQLRNILDDSEASRNDKFVALELLKNANVAAGMVLPGCQDTGTATIMGKKGQYVWTDEKDEEALSKGVFKAYTETNLRCGGWGVDEEIGIAPTNCFIYPDAMNSPCIIISLPGTLRWRPCPCSPRRTREPTSLPRLT